MFRLPVILILLFSALSHAAKLEFEGLRSHSSKDLKKAIAGRLDYIAKRSATAPFLKLELSNQAPT